MSQIPENLKYTEQHEWVRIDENGTAVCGITDHAQRMLSDIVFVELPQTGKQVKEKEPVAVVESVKAVSDVFAPVSGSIEEVNTNLEESPETVNTSAYDEGWMFKIKTSSSEEIEKLLSSDQYSKLVEEEEEEG